MSTTASQPTENRSLLAWLRASIRNRLTAIVIGASLIPVLLVSIILGVATFSQVQTVLTDEAFAKLEAVQRIKTTQVESYLRERQGDMVALRETAAVLRESSLNKLTSVTTLKNQALTRLFAGWDEDVRDVASDPGVVAGVLDLEVGFQELGTARVRSLYQGQSDLPDAGDGSIYSVAHVEQHNFFTGYIAIHGFEDVYLIDSGGNVVYSAGKGESFGINLETANYRDTNLAYLYRNLRSAPADQSLVTDMGIFDGSVAMFIGSPIVQDNTVVGILAYRLPLSAINEIVAERSGLGETGETYLVGPDKLFRSPSIFEQVDTTFNPEFVVDTPAVNSALEGETGHAIYFGYRGIQVVAEYAPVNIPNLQWAILTVVDVAEAFAPRLEGQDKDFYAQYREAYGYYDIFLIDPEGYIFYTVVRESDYQTNILTGTYSNSNLGALVKEVLSTKTVGFVDFASYAPSAGAPAAFLSIPLLDEAGNVQMIIAAQVSLAQINSIMAQSTGLGETGETYLVGPDQLWRNDSRFLEELGTTSTVLNTNFRVDTDASRSALAGESGEDIITDYRGARVASVWSPVVIKPATANSEEQRWALIAEVDENEALAPVNRMATTVAVIVGLTVLVFGALAVAVGSRFAIGFVAPIIELSGTATQVAGGNLNLTVEEKSDDEIGVLSKAFNSMTVQLRNIIGSLEQRVAERTQSLELASEVGRAVSQVRNLDDMLEDAAELIRSNFDLYYVQVYLVSPSRTELVLRSGTGKVGADLIGRGHRLPLNTGSINGRAAIEKRSVIVANTETSATFRPNPLLPDTRSEMAVPLQVGDRVVGVLDLQARTPGQLSEEVLSAFEALAGQLAIAIQNANLLAETNAARAELEVQARRLTRTAWTEYLDGLNKPESFGYVFEQDEVKPVEGEVFSLDGSDGLEAPIAVAGEPLGSLVIDVEESKRTSSNLELMSTVARQVAQQIENLRLLDAAERYRHDAEEAARRLTREGWEEYLTSQVGKSFGFFYDSKEVKPFEDESPAAGDAQVALPLKVRDETIGKLAVLGVDSHDHEAVELASTVAERLSQHIENLRLLEETQLGQMELNKRARQLASVSEISTVSSRELDIDKMLATVVHMTQRQFGLYHAHVFTFNEFSQKLEIVACGWKEGDEHEGTHGTTAIPLAQEQSLVARAARTRAAVVVNDVRSDAGWLPNPLLPDTLSELAVPLVIGDRLLGVMDVQSDKINAFSEQDISIQATLASQIATALQNAYSFARAQRQAEREAMLNTINQKIQSATSVEAVLQIAARELGHALGAPRTIAQLSMKEKN